MFLAPLLFQELLSVPSETAFRHIHNSGLRTSDTLIFTLFLLIEIVARYNVIINRPYGCVCSYAYANI